MGLYFKSSGAVVLILLLVPVISVVFQLNPLLGTLSSALPCTEFYFCVLFVDVVVLCKNLINICCSSKNKTENKQKSVE